jgi:hypothetical protein
MNSNSNPNQAKAVPSEDNTSSAASSDENGSRKDVAAGVDDETPPTERANISTVATNGEQPQQQRDRDQFLEQPQQRAKDPFLFFSNSENLRKARAFEEPDYSTEEALHDDGVTIRKSRISYEIDMATMMMAIMAETNGD